MAPPRLKETGAEIIQLAFAIPLLVLSFGLCAQFCIWATTAVQFANAAEFAAYHVDIDDLCDAGIGSASSEDMITKAIASRMVGIDEDDVQVSDVTLTMQPGASDSDASANGSTAKGDRFELFESSSHGVLGFSATCSVPCIIGNAEGLSVTGTWLRDRLLSKTSEVRYERG